MSGDRRRRVEHSSQYHADPRSPVGLFRRDRPDRFMLALERLAAGIEPLTALLRPGHPPPKPREDLRMRVARVERSSDDVAVLTLAPTVFGATLPAWQPGHHVDVLLDGGVLRQYSLNGDPADRSHYRIAVRRIKGGLGSGLVHGLAEGDTVELRGPRNAFPFVRAERYLFLAGGIGITPILPMVKAAHAVGRPFRLVYTGRARHTMPFLNELPEDADVFVRPDDEYGTPGAAELLAGLEPGTAVYVCGPAPLISGVRALIPEGTPFFSERFSPAPIIDGRPFEVRLGPSGQVLRVAEDETALDVLRRARPDTPYSCRQGFCGTCRVGLLEGTPEHRDRLTGGSSRGGDFIPCVSRAAEGERLVLDL